MAERIKEEKPSNVKEIVEAYLKENGYQGLCTNADDGCSCKRGDLFPCSGEWALECVPGYRTICKECARHGECEFEREDWKPDCIQAEKPEVKK